MKRMLLMLMMTVTAYLSTNGQSFVQVGVDSSVQSYFYGPLYRSSATSSFDFSNYVYLYTAAELSTLPSGALITGVQWQAQAGTGGLTGTNTFNIHMENSTQTAVAVTGNNYTAELTNATAVYQNSSYTLQAGGGWIDHPFPTPFIYTGGNLKILTAHEMAGTASGVINFHWEQATGLAGGIASSSNTTTSTFSTSYSNRRPNIRISYIVPTGLDLAVQGIISPAAPIGAGAPGQVQVTLANYAADPITSAAVTYQIDNQTPVTESFAGSILSANTATFTFATAIVAPSNPFVVKVWVSNVNGLGPDNNVSNDTLQINVCPAMPGGTYTIGATLADFPDVQAAVNAMQCGGISGPVTFLIQPGSYQVAANISNIIGTGVNGVSFASATGIATDVLLYNDTSVTQQEIFNISGTPGVSFTNLSFVRSVAPSGTSHLIHYQSGSDNAVVTGCRFIDSSGTTLAAARGVGITASSGLTIIANVFDGVNSPVYLSGTGLNNNVSVNIIQNYGYRGIYVQNQSQIIIDGNTMSNFTGTSTVGGGIYTTSNEFMTISNNRILGNLSRYGIYLSNYNSSPTQPTLVFNNVIAGERAPQVSGAMLYSPFYIVASFSATATPPNPLDYAEIVNNTVHVDVSSTSTSTLNALFYATGGSATTPAYGKTIFKNNNFSAIASSMPANFRAVTFSIPAVVDSFDMNHNNYHFANSTNDLLKVNSPSASYNDLAAWRIAFPQLDSNSVSVDPTMASLTVPVPSAAGLNNLGLPISYVFSDVLGIARNATTPDIGAYEFEPSSLDLGIAQLLSPTQNCGLTAAEAVTVEFVNNGLDTAFTYQASLYFNGALVVTDTINTMIVPGGLSTYTFSQTVNMGVGGSYGIQAVVALAGDGNVLNDTITETILNPLVSVFPLTQNFEQMSNGIPASFPDGWSTSATSTFVFQINSGTTTSTATGPTTDNTLGTAAGKYIYTEASSGSSGDTAILQSPCLDMSSLILPVLEYHYHMYGSDITGLLVQADVGGVWQQIDILNGPQQTANADPYVMRRALIPPTAAAVRFVVVRGGSFNGDVALDDIRILESPSLDVSLNGLVTPALSGCGFTNSEIVSIRLINSGQDTLNSVPMAYVVNGGTAVLDTFTLQILPGDTAIASFTTPLDLSIPGFYTLQAYTSLVGDGDLANDTTMENIASIPLISTLPYVDDFESGGIGWTTGGASSTWALGVPNNTNIDTAASGTQAWVTNLTGNYNANENSYIQSPCFDFSNVQGAVVELDIMRDSENGWDGSQLLYSIDGGNTWVVLGGLNTGLSNWYNNQNTSGPLAGQPVWTDRLSAQGWVTASHSLAALDNQASVLFRVSFQSDGSVQYEGTGVDNFRVRVPQDPVITFVTEASDSCAALPRTIEAGVRNFVPLINVDLHYDTAGTGTFVIAPMVYNASDSLWSATIPAATPATTVSYFVTVLDSAGLVDTSMSFSYVDDYLAIFAGNDTTITAGDTANLRATVTGFTSSSIVDAMRTGGNGSSGVSFNVRAISSILLDSLYVPIYGTIGNTATVNVWYQPQAITAAPNVSTAPWVQVVTGATAPVLNQGTTGGALLSAVAIPGNLTIPAGQTYGFFYAITSGSTVYTTHSTTMVDTFTDGNLVIYTGVGAGFGGSAPTPTIATRSFNGSVGYKSNTGLTWTELSSGNVLATGTDTLDVSPMATTTYIVTVADSLCSESDTVTVFVNANITVDAGVSAIISPTAPDLTSASTVLVVIENFGTDPLTGFDVAYSVGGIEINANAISRTVQPGDTIHHIFSQSWTPTVGGDVDFCAYVKGVTGDIDLANDTSCVTFIALDIQESTLLSRVYPNPAKDFVNFEFKAQQGQAKLIILDQIGKIVSEAMIDLTTAHSWELNTQAYAAGMYTYRLVVDSQVEQGKFIVSK